ncbi:hypothetical protein [Mangrovimonas aestuarii]|uniref:hypothetical protein n=1 Tax=Mangrovimonas aestuarii TaxID=3018443 RepID=UPI002379C8B5|nr:hypothetical protein [Mangrovimonas aestuarii]
MRKTLLLLTIMAITFACKNDSKTKETPLNENEKTEKQNDGLTLLRGEFVYYEDAAVLQTHREIYGVVQDEMMQELNKRAQAFKIEPTDFVTVEVRGKITPKPEGTDGWEHRVEIKEILNVKETSPNTHEAIKLGK